MGICNFSEFNIYRLLSRKRVCEKSMDTCVILVTYNRLELLKESIQAILGQTEAVNHIIVVNNNSTDGTREFLDSVESDQIIVHNSSKNVGGAGGFNLGLKLAYTKTKDAYFWLMDDDTVVDQFANEKFLIHCKELKDKFGFLCSNVRWKDNTPTNIPIPSEDWPEFASRDLIKVDYGSFVSFFVNRNVVSQVGLPISDFFLWFDDNDYSLRLRKIYPAYFMTDVLVKHKSATNKVAVGILTDTEDRIDRYFYFYRNLLYLWKVHFHKYYKRVLLKKLLKSFLIVFKARDHRFKRQLTAFKGLYAAINFNPQIEKFD